MELNTTMKTMMTIVMLISMMKIVIGYKRLQEQIPNGDRIPHPCGGVWGGVGHAQPGGAGKRNQFGIDFKSASMTWKRELCMKDSDGDGRTNGEELGDPDCLWAPGLQPKLSTNLSHPGICEPFDSPQCQKGNQVFGDKLDCTLMKKEFCPSIKQKGMRRTKFRLPQTTIPNLVTNYLCMMFNMPSDGDFHLVATTPLVNNTNLVHHMILWGCDVPEAASEVFKAKVGALKDAYACGMVPHKYCQKLIGTWTIGSQGDCVSRDAGFRIGRHGFKIAALQVHYNNPEMLADQTDNSGMTLYYTANKRVHDAAIFLVGQEAIKIPPHTPSISFDSTCPSDCTEEMFKQTVYISRAVNHMHYLGKKQSMSLYRDGKKLLDLTNDAEYNYDSPKFYHYDPPIEMHPGDEIRTRCTYTSHRNITVEFGAGTDNEMCYGFLTYFPAHDIASAFCANWKTIPRCRRYLSKFNGMIDSCEWKKMLNVSDPTTQKLFFKFFTQENCGYFVKNKQCSQNCSDVVETLSEHPCLQNDIGEFIKHRLQYSDNKGQMFLKIMNQCSVVNDASSHLKHSNFIVIIMFVLLSIY